MNKKTKINKFAIIVTVFVFITLITFSLLFISGFFSSRARLFSLIEKEGGWTQFRLQANKYFPRFFVFTYSKLDKIVLDHTSNVDKIPFEWVALIHEQFSLNASNSKVNDEILSKISLMQNIEELEFRECPDISDEGIKKLGKMKNLRCLNLFSVECSDKGCADLRNLSNLQYLVVAHTKVNGDCFELAGWKMLKLLDLNYCNLRKDFIEIISTLPRLQTLRLTYYDGIFDDIQPLLLKNSIRFIEINIYDIKSTNLEHKQPLHPKIKLVEKEYFKPVKTSYDRYLSDLNL
jgi:hypothetical protein